MKVAATVKNLNVADSVTIEELSYELILSADELNALIKSYPDIITALVAFAKESYSCRG